jgi:hypothetical protein
MGKGKEEIQWMASELLLQMIKNGPIAPAIKAIKGTSLTELKEALDTEDKRKAFWINLYNGAFLVLRKKNQLKAPKIFTTPRIKFADFSLSLDDIEHGILRKGQWKYGLGYFKRPFIRREVTSLMVDELDYRIHFVLNCGAKSCPLIRIYDDLKLTAQLNRAQNLFVKEESQEQGNQLWISKIFLWFYGDFGGKRGIVNLHHKVLKLKRATYSIKYYPYDWSPAHRFEK